MAIVIGFNVVRSLRNAQRAGFILNCSKEIWRKWTCPCVRLSENFGRCEYSNSTKADNTTLENGPGSQPKKKKIFEPQVTLLSEDNEMSVVTLEMAQKISSRRNLKLVKIIDYDTKTERPTYKLMTSKQYLQEGLETKKQLKQEAKTQLKPQKLMSISSKISDHDLQTKIKSVMKLLAKKHEIRILISIDDNKEKTDAMLTQIQTAVKDLTQNVTQTTSNHNIKIHLHPRLETAKPDGSIGDANDSAIDQITCKS